MRALHAEGKKRGLDHDDLRSALGVASLADVETKQLASFLAGWTKKVVRDRKKELPRRGYVQAQDEIEMVGSEDLALIQRAFDVRGLDAEQRIAFVKRQLRGRAEVRTRADFYKVFSGVRAMNRRQG